MRIKGTVRLSKAKGVHSGVVLLRVVGRSAAVMLPRWMRGPSASSKKKSAVTAQKRTAGRQRQRATSASSNGM